MSSGFEVSVPTTYRLLLVTSILDPADRYRRSGSSFFGSYQPGCTWSSCEVISDCRPRIFYNANAARLNFAAFARWMCNTAMSG
jgi:hypothetical protein